ncbi:MAG: M3 family metallopeptidase [Pseudomonadota bacterium]
MTNPLLDTTSLPRFTEISPDDVQPALGEIISANREKLERLLANASAPDFDSVVAELEDMEHELHRVWSPVSHLQSVLGSNDWRDAYNDALPLMTEYGTELSQNQQLQQAYAAVDQSLAEKENPARKRVVAHALRAFRLAGVDLPEGKKARFKTIMQEIAARQAAFEQNVQDASDAWSLLLDNEAALAGLPTYAIERAAADARERQQQGWLLTLDFPTYLVVMTHADDASLRETLYRAWCTRASDQGADAQWDNADNMANILALRHEAAQLVGFDSYADYSLATKMADSADQVIAFLHELADHSRTAAEAEFTTLTEFAGRRLEPWDITYWHEKLKQEKYSVSDEELRQYFPANTVVDGLFALAERLFGIQLEQQDAVSTWHDDVRYFSVQDDGSALIGGFYVDLFARSGKRTGAWVDECIGRKKLDSHATLPVGYLVCNFPPPDELGRSLLSHSDVVTLFHEFGHMLHHLLTRIDYPSIAGINGVAWDAVELPSQFLENFAWSYDVLTRCSSHTSDGQPLPRELFDKLENSRHFGEAMAMVRQLEFALFDMRLHAEYDPNKGPRILDTIDEVRNEMAVIQHPEYNRMPFSFSHIFAGGYAAGYYSYKWAEVLAADAFGAFQEAGLFDAETAARFRREILEVGGSRDIMDAFIAFRGREPTIDALLEISGIKAA